MAVCKAKKKDGKPCESAARASGYCFIHDPSQAKERAKARKLGGRNRKRGAGNTPYPDADTKTAQGLTTFLDALLRETWQLEQGIARSRTLAYIVSVQKSVLEVGELENRLEAIESVLKNREAKE